MQQADRAFLAICLVAAVILTAACNSATAPSSDTAVNLFDGRVTFVPPPGLKQISPVEAEPGIEKSSLAKYAFANDDRSAYVLVGMDEDMPLGLDQLEDVKRFTEGLHKRYSKWKTSEIIKMNGRQWFNFEWITPPPDPLETLVAPPLPEDESTPTPRDERPFHYNSYSTSFDNKLLSFNYKALPEQYTAHQESFVKSANSINIRN